MRMLLLLLGRVTLLGGLALLLPMALALLWQEPEAVFFALPAAVAIGVGALLAWLGRHHKHQLSVREGAAFMVLVWLVFGCVGMLPYGLSGTLGWETAFFESVSAFTTTGATCLPGPAPRTLIFWRSILEWLGGLNFIVLLVTVVPQVSGCFGMTLSAHQTIRFSPVLNRMYDTACQAAKIYAGVTLFSAVLYWLVGLDKFDSFTRAMVTMSTSSMNSAADFMQYDSLPLELAGMLSMLLASGNFLVYGKAVSRRNFREIWQDNELRTFLGLILAAGLLVAVHLWHSQVYDLADSLRFGFFQVISFASTSGFASASFGSWPDFDRYVLFILVFVGGCIGSTTGGLKVMRFAVLFKMAAAEMRRTLHPHMVINIVMDGASVPMKIVGRILSFFFLYMLVFVLFVFIIALSGVTVMQAMGIAVGCLSSVGSAAALYGFSDYALLPAWTKLACCLLMVLGRLEIFSFLILLHTGIHPMRHKW